MLHQIIRDMLTEADASPYKTIRRALKRGLIIEITNQRTAYQLAISRKDGTSPSDAEWNTVCKHWTYPIAGAHYEHTGTHMKGRITRQRSYA